MKNLFYHTISSLVLAGTLLAAPMSSIIPDPHPDTLRVMSYNVWYAFNEGKHKTEGLEWVSSQTADVVSLQELTNIKPEKLQEYATAWNHPHSALLKTSGFSVGLTSRYPIEVIEKRVKGMHHGYLHARINDIHYFAVHLSPFKWAVRQREADILSKAIVPLIEQNQSVIVLGDFNAVSSGDKEWLEAKSNSERIANMKKTDDKHGHVQNLKDGKFHYGTLNTFFKAGLVDTAEKHLPRKPENRLSIPTGVHTKTGEAPERGSRIDFILASKDLKVKGCQIVTEGVVNKVSDHYPVITDFTIK